jgi:YesN/AraC family two-component response regulator
MITLVIVDDHKVVRQGIRSLLESENDLRVVGEGSDGLDGFRLVESQHPDVLVTDLTMPERHRAVQKDTADLAGYGMRYPVDAWG